ncbi:MAG: helix-turn-helix transcriptional regulator [Acidobacteria bacterium]|nr:helix-turn-helix transcriptional regulator [Acidobacteriota bacterium]
MSMHLLPGSYYGETLRRRQVAGLELTERVYSPGYQTPKHTHKQALFCYVMQGSYTENYGGKVRECHASTLLFHPPGELHAEHFHDAGGHSFIVEMTPDWMAQTKQHLTVADNSAHFQGGAFELLSRKLYREFTQPDEASSLIIEGVVMEMLGETVRHANAKEYCHSPGWLRQARELVHERFTENLTLTEIAGNVGVHPVHLAQTFRKTYQCTVGEEMRKLRIEYACRALANSDQPIVEIALAAGFCDQSHFTRTFKSALGITPSQYRDALRGA